MSILQLAFWMFAAAAGGGLLFVALMAMAIPYPAWLGAIHGSLGLVALATLATALVRSTTRVPAPSWWSLAVFASALFGAFLFFRLPAARRESWLVVIVHGGLAVVGLSLLHQVAF
jgi:hypothetical protein